MGKIIKLKLNEMRFTAALLASTAAAFSTTSKYMQYMAEHGKSYLTKEEFQARKALFAAADEFVESHNQTNANFTVGHNKFSDMSESEKASYRGRIPKAAKTGETRSFSALNLPESVDWRGTCVNAIRDQGQCGSCWAFSSVASLEGAHCVATGTLSQFSEQQLVDCAYVKYGNFGCNGGLEDNAFNYYESNAAIARDDYPYTATKGTCQASTMNSTGVEVSTYVDITSESESDIMAAIAQQPISVAIQANRMVFQLYNGGIFDSTSCGTSLDHAVALVGYGTEGGQAYYILRNSWGTSWGESGYMRIATDGNGDGICGVQMEPCYPESN